MLQDAQADPVDLAFYPGNPNPAQLSMLDDIADRDMHARVIGWHYPTDGPLIVRGTGEWQSILPSGTPRVLVRVSGHRA